MLLLFFSLSSLPVPDLQSVTKFLYQKMKPDLRTTCCTYSPLKTFCIWGSTSQHPLCKPPLRVFLSFCITERKPQHSPQKTTDPTTGPPDCQTQITGLPNASLMTAFETV